MGLESLEQIADHSVKLSELIDNFRGVIRGMAIGADPKTEKDVCMMKVELGDGRFVTQKLKGIHIKKLLENCKAMQIKEMGDLVDHGFYFEKTTFEIGFPRWLPVKKIRV